MTNKKGQKTQIRVHYFCHQCGARWATNIGRSSAPQYGQPLRCIDLQCTNICWPTGKTKQVGHEWLAIIKQKVRS